MDFLDKFAAYVVALGHGPLTEEMLAGIGPTTVAVVRGHAVVGGMTREHVEHAFKNGASAYINAGARVPYGQVDMQTYLAEYHAHTALRQAVRELLKAIDNDPDAVTNGMQASEQALNYRTNVIGPLRAKLDALLTTEPPAADGGYRSL